MSKHEWFNSLTREQKTELKWFAKNILGTRQEFYKFYDQMNSYKMKIDRLSEQSRAIMDHCKEAGITDFETTEEKNELLQ